MATIELTDLTKGEVRSLSGQERGVAARERFAVDAFDESEERVVVRARGIESVTPSFLQGMFSKSIRRFGSRERFLAHYAFDASPELLRQIDRAIRNTLIDRQSLFH